ncbi:SIR2 family NAD-dependent protein deacylase [Salisediminibacterium selenitireducens]|uniref:protein acetyllysine N-acetyltransferase n=1 Tax=Bacillus selenitireducens (strain ATCC 700615 / DSM 15326 / MLS10) TaxID=439292 RepID=D6XZ51_BACIE|nr:NAD-dependent deacylase [Salisediminibacterium selenitireducens]ADI00336.1 Silent information regulator protein Sir2 [[Bacillus] selenitireducens MLS10]
MKQTATWLKTADSVVVLTGAGMSTESNIPDFRSRSGWWQQVDPMTIATPEALEGNPEQFKAFYKARLEALEEAEPNRGHQIIARWEERGLVDRVATQNVDGLHQRAGSRNVDALHGTIHAIRCHRCDRPHELDAFLRDEACVSCGGVLRPGVVLFGEMLPQDAWQRALKAIEKADVVLVIGTSLDVYPVNQLPSVTGGKTVYINRDIDQSIHAFDAVHQGSAGEILEELDRLMEA